MLLKGPFAVKFSKAMNKKRALEFVDGYDEVMDAIMMDFINSNYS